MRRGWVRYDDARLMELRLKDLDLRIEGTWLAACLDRLMDELEARGIRFRPHAWLSTEWFSPDGIPGIAIPFYLAHPRLIKLERKQMLAVEGGTVADCMRILRHEAGHALDSAYRLHFKPEWRKHFGRFSDPYPDTYRPKPSSRRHVLHLDSWYAQAHPAEDFAETFAVWLTPRSPWRSRYADWPVALAKLRYVDRLMEEHVVAERPRVVSRARVDPVHRLTTTLGSFYEKKRERYTLEWSDLYDPDLLRIFSDDPRDAAGPTAASFLRKLRSELRRTVVEWTGVPPYTVDQVLHEMIDRCRTLRLRLAGRPGRARTAATLMLTVHTLSCLNTKQHEFPL